MRICIITGSRAEWGLLQPLARLVHKDKDIDLKLLVTGSHLSHEFGYTKNDIELPIEEEIECILSSDTAVGISKALGLAVISFSEAFKRIAPDLVVVLGDRWEILACSIAAHVANIPLAHIHGGESTEGSYDNAWRHSITHMAQLHFPAAYEYGKKIVQLGADPSCVFPVGTLGCDANFKPVFTKGPFAEKYVIVFHPVTNEDDFGCYQAQAMVDVIGNRMTPMGATSATMIDCVVIAPGHDKGSRAIRKIFDFHFEVRESMPQHEYFSHLKISDAIIGNSSSGIIEAPTVGVPTINIGNRQNGRLMADSIIQAEPTRKSIKQAFDRLYSKEFKDLMNSDYTIYYRGENVAEKIFNAIKMEVPKN